MLLGCACTYSAGDPQQIRRFVPERITASPEATIKRPQSDSQLSAKPLSSNPPKEPRQSLYGLCLAFFTAFKNALSGKPRHPKVP